MVKFPQLTTSELIKRLDPPTRKVRLVLDTDTYNEIDDQFAVVHALLSPDILSLLLRFSIPDQKALPTGWKRVIRKYFAC